MSRATACATVRYVGVTCVLVTGGAGNLGRHVSRELLRRGHDVRALVHRSVDVEPGATVVKGNVVTGKGIDVAVAGVDAVVHTATRPGRRAAKTEVRGTETVLEAAVRADAHFVYPSIVGVDRHRFSYYDAKWEAEGVIEASGTRWTIQRTTQFHELIDRYLSAVISPQVPGLAFQPVEVSEVAARLADLVEAGPAGHAPDFGGPELLGVKTLARQRHEITGRRSRLVRVPRVAAMRDFARGVHLSPEHRDGTITWSDWLERREETS